MFGFFGTDKKKEDAPAPQPQQPAQPQEPKRIIEKDGYCTEDGGSPKS